MLSLHCIAKLAVCCRHAEKVGDFDEICENDQAKFIDNLIQIHTKTLELMKTTDSIYEISNLGQLLCTMSLVVVLVFQIQTTADKIVIIILVTVLFQLFSYCFLGECVSVMVSWSLNKLITINEFFHMFSVWKTWNVALLLKVVRNLKHCNEEEDSVNADDDARIQRILSWWI